MMSSFIQFSLYSYVRSDIYFGLNDLNCFDILWNVLKILPLLFYSSTRGT